MPPKTPEQLQQDFQKQMQARQAMQQQQGLPGYNAQQAADRRAQQAARPTMTAEAPPPPDIERRAGPSGFVGFGQQLAANKDVAARMAKLAGGQVEDYGADVGLMRTDAGRQALLQKAYGQATGLDAALAGASSPDYYTQLERQYGPEAQRKAAAAQAAEAERLRQEAEAQRQAAAQAADAQAQAESERQAQRAAQRQAIGDRPTDSEWAAYNGMTLKEWKDAGRNPPLPS